MECKIKGEHSTGYLAGHQLQKISDYYLDAAKRLEIKEPKLDARKFQLKKLLEYLDSQIEVINNKTSELQTNLKLEFQKVLAKLESISKQKLSFLMSEQLEVKRQYDFIEWMESFIKYEKEMLPPNNFLVAWTKYP
jgi:SLT domain-containing protein